MNRSIQARFTSRQLDADWAVTLPCLHQWGECRLLGKRDQRANMESFSPKRDNELKDPGAKIARASGLSQLAGLPVKCWNVLAVAAGRHDRQPAAAVESAVTVQVCGKEEDGDVLRRGHQMPFRWFRGAAHLDRTFDPTSRTSRRASL